MKSYHVVLLVAGAGLAAGLAYKMTQLPPIPMPAAARQVVSAPSAPDVPIAKPSPIPGKTRVARPLNGPVTALASAPETVYTEPPKPVERVERKTQPVVPAKPARKNEAISVATSRRPSVKPPSLKPASVKTASAKPPSIRPKQWIPSKYESPVESSASPKTPAPQVFAKPAPAPVVLASIDKSAAPPVVPAIEQQSTPATPAQPPVLPHQATLQTGMTIAIRLDQPLSIDFTRAGATFAGELLDPLIANGFVIAERGAHVNGRVLELQKAGRFTGTSRLVLGLTNVYTSDGQQVAITTERWMRLGDTLPAETAIRFRLTSTVTITERQLAAK